MDPQEVLGLIDNLRELSAQYVNPYSATILEWLRWAFDNLPYLAGETWEFIRGVIALIRSIIGA